VLDLLFARPSHPLECVLCKHSREQLVFGINKYLQRPRTVIPQLRHVLFSCAQHHLNQSFCSVKRGKLEKNLPMPFRVEHSRDLTIRVFPNKNTFLKRHLFQIRVGKPVPVVPAGNMPAEFAAVIEAHHLAQKIPDFPVIVTASVRTHNKSHSSPPFCLLCLFKSNQPFVYSILSN